MDLLPDRPRSLVGTAHDPERASVAVATARNASPYRASSQGPTSTSTSVLSSAHVTIWNRIEQRKISGNAAPLGRNVERYLKQHIDCEVYKSQDRELLASRNGQKRGRENPAEALAGNHVAIWNRVEKRKITGKAVPLAKNLKAYLLKRPDCEVYENQDEEIKNQRMQRAKVARRARGVQHRAVNMRVSVNLRGPGRVSASASRSDRSFGKKEDDTADSLTVEVKSQEIGEKRQDDSSEEQEKAVVEAGSMMGATEPVSGSSGREDGSIIVEDGMFGQQQDYWNDLNQNIEQDVTLASMNRADFGHSELMVQDEKVCDDLVTPIRTMAPMYVEDSIGNLMIDVHHFFLMDDGDESDGLPGIADVFGGCLPPLKDIFDSS